jgi:N-acetyl-anhydromuramyl-L-alanine amidase AmpD
MVDQQGKIYYLVDEKRLASHAPPYNDISIGIELINSGLAKDQFTDQQYDSLNKLIRSIITRWPNIQAQNSQIIGHYEVPGSVYSDGKIRKWDPSPNFDWAKIGLNNHQTMLQVIKAQGLPENYLYTTLASAGYDRAFLSQHGYA